MPRAGRTRARRRRPRCTRWRPPPTRLSPATWTSRSPAGPTSASTRSGSPCRPGRARWAPTRCASTRPTRPGCCPGRAAAWWCWSARRTPGRRAYRSTRRSRAGAGYPPRRPNWPAPRCCGPTSGPGWIPRTSSSSRVRAPAPPRRTWPSWPRSRSSGAAGEPSRRSARFRPASVTPGRRQASRAWSRRPWRWPRGRSRPAPGARGRIRSSHRATGCSGCRRGRRPGRTTAREPAGLPRPGSRR